MRDQLTCGSCYAFASTSTIDERTRILTADADQVYMSPQDVVSCSPYSQGCDGGFPYLVFKYGMDYGYVKDACLPYNMSLWEQVGGGKATVDHYLDRDLPCE